MRPANFVMPATHPAALQLPNLNWCLSARTVVGLAVRRQRRAWTSLAFSRWRSRSVGQTPLKTNVKETALDQEPKLPRVYNRRLSDKILIAFDQACDQGDLEAATDLLRIAETILLRRPAHASLDR